MIALLLLFCGCADHSSHPTPAVARDLVALADPRIGTGGLGYSVGCGFPGATLPHGLVKVSPDTASQSGAAPGFYHGGGYHADDPLVQGFSHLHAHGIGLTAYGIVSLMPADGFDASKTTEAGYELPLDKSSETAVPGRYDVRLLSADGAPVVDVTLTATEHTALHRYRYAEGTSPTVILDLAHVLDGGEALGASLSIDPTTGEFKGWMDNRGDMGPEFRTWFDGVLDPPPRAVGTWADADPVEGATTAEGVQAGGWFSYDADDLTDGTVSVRLALSLVDAEGAAANLAAEHDGFDVEQDADAARAAWAALLDRIQVYGGSDEDATIFATALYHSLLMPTAIDDVDGRYMGFDGEIHTTDSHYYTDFSLWDTYRTEHPLLALLWPEAQTDMLRSLARMSEQGGSLPLWPLATWDAGAMLGSPAQVVIGESWQKGLLRDADGQPDPDAEVLLDAALEVATGADGLPYGTRPDVSLYDSLGYYPSDQVGRSVAWTQEVSVADAALAPMAEDLGQPDEAAMLRERSEDWKNVYDPAVGYFHARLSDGSFSTDFDDLLWSDEYAEGNARQYLWLAQQDPEGLIDELGGDAAFVERLDAFFEASAREDQTFWPRENYWHGNEPDIHAPWLFALAGRPDLSRTWVDWVIRTFYGTGADGLAGNDDAGTLSAWYAWSAMGIYPLAGTDRYVLGATRFDRVEFPIEGGTLCIRASDSDSPALDGQAWSSPTVPHATLIRGGVLSLPGAP